MINQPKILKSLVGFLVCFASILFIQSKFLATVLTASNNLEEIFWMFTILNCVFLIGLFFFLIKICVAAHSYVKEQEAKL